MQLDIDKEVALLQRMTVGQLREKFEETWGEPTNTRNKQWLVKRIAWKMQANIEGDISQRARRRAAELARGSDIRTTAPKAIKPSPKSKGDTVTGFVQPEEDNRLPPPRSEIERVYKGEKIVVLVLDSAKTDRYSRGRTNTQPGVDLNHRACKTVVPKRRRTVRHKRILPGSSSRPTPRSDRQPLSHGRVATWTCSRVHEAISTCPPATAPMASRLPKASDQHPQIPSRLATTIPHDRRQADAFRKRSPSRLEHLPPAHMYPALQAMSVEMPRARVPRHHVPQANARRRARLATFPRLSRLPTDRVE